MPAEFQKAIDTTLRSLKNTYSFLDDIIIVTGGGIKNHKEQVFECLERFDKENLSINLEKCHFANNKIEWLGFEINQHGIKPLVTQNRSHTKLEGTQHM